MRLFDTIFHNCQKLNLHLSTTKLAISSKFMGWVGFSTPNGIARLIEIISTPAPQTNTPATVLVPRHVDCTRYKEDLQTLIGCTDVHVQHVPKFTAFPRNPTTEENMAEWVISGLRSEDACNVYRLFAFPKSKRYDKCRDAISLAESKTGVTR
mgnify:CR=1 FL=1